MIPSRHSPPTTVRMVADGSNPKGLGQASLGLGDALALAGTREGGTHASRMRQRLSKGNQYSGPGQRAQVWSSAQLRLGRCLALIGERDQAPALTSRCSASVPRRSEGTRRLDCFPADFVAAQMGLGNTLLGLEEREAVGRCSSEAAEAYRRPCGPGASGTSRRCGPMRKLNLGLALLGLGEQQGAEPSISKCGRRVSSRPPGYHAGADTAELGADSSSISPTLWRRSAIAIESRPQRSMSRDRSLHMPRSRSSAATASR